MTVYPFYTEVNSSTRKETTGVGCRAKNGYMETLINQRDNGAITTPYKIVQNTFQHEDGHIVLTTSVYFQGECIHEHTTDY